MEWYQLDHSLDSYIAKLKQYGVQANPKLQPAIFRLKNGLKYPGLLTNQKVSGLQELVRVPIKHLLTAHNARKDPQLQQIYSNTFYKEGQMWQDRILVTYLLFLLSTNRKCIWLDMVQQFSKDIDILSFWQQAQLLTFVDKTVIKAAQKQRLHFQQQWRRFEDIQSEYSQLLDLKWFNKQNYKWIYIHTISRCFGSYLNSTYFVPFCQLFNHNYVDVSYACINDKNKNQKQTMQQQDGGGGEITDGGWHLYEQSVSSGYSQDYLSDDDFDYMSINSYIIKWNCKISYDLKEKETRIVQKLLHDVYEWMDRELEWRGFTLIYLGQIIQKFKILENQYKAGRKKFQYTTQKIQETKNHVYAFRKYLVQFYRTQGREYQKIKNQRGVSLTQARETTWSNYDKKKQDTKQKYSDFIMEAREKAHFQAKRQIYFCYGKLSNRTLLIRYGFSLQNNPYEHVWVKFQLGKNIQPYPDLFEQVQVKGLSVNYKVKLKAYTFTLEPILLMRTGKWQLTHHGLQDIFFVTDIDKELDVLERVKIVYENYMSRYADINEDLTDERMGYHQYFVRVYNNQKKKILSLQIKIINYVCELLNKLKNHQINLKTLKVDSQFQKQLKHYLKHLRGLTGF